MNPTWVGVQAVLVAGGLLTLTLPARAQPVAAPPSATTATPPEKPELVTDRPDFTESSEVIGRGFLQFESGFSYEGDHQAGTRTRSVTLPAALVRIGLGYRTELRLSADGWLSELVHRERTSGHSDVEVGAKVRVLHQDARGVDLALIPMVSLPLGDDAFTSGGADPTLKITWARDLPEGYGLSGNVNLSSLSEGAERFHQEAVSVSVGHAIAAEWSGYVELYGFTKLSRGGGAAITLNGGVACLIGEDMQIDLEAGHGLTRGSPDWFVGVGFSIRRPLGRQ